MPIIPIQPTPEDPKVDQDVFEVLRSGFEQDRIKREQVQQQVPVIEGGAGVSVDVGSGGKYTVSRLE